MEDEKVLDILEKTVEEVVKNDSLPVCEESFTPEIPDTVELPIIENPDDREYEEVEIEVEGGV